MGANDEKKGDVKAVVTPEDPVLAKNAATIRRLGKRVTADIVEIGRLLAESKEILGHGNFLPWIEREFGWVDRTAERFMQVYHLSGKFDKMSNLEVPITGLYLLAAPSTPESARDEVIERTKSGETITSTQLRTIIETHKRPKATSFNPLSPPILKPACASEKPQIPNAQPPVPDTKRDQPVEASPDISQQDLFGTAPSPVPSEVPEESAPAPTPPAPKLDIAPSITPDEPSPSSDPVTTEKSLWLWDTLCEFERRGVLTKATGEILSAMTHPMLNDVHRLAPQLATWLNTIGAVS